jgi:hypothetical protein
MTCQIPLSQGEVALVDDEDYSRLAVHTWSLLRTGRGGYPYAARSEQREGKVRTIYLHREVMNAQPGQFVDHKRTEDTLDCRRNNLRFATRQENGANSKTPGNATGYRNVRRKGGAYAVYVCRDYHGPSHATARSPGSTFPTVLPGQRRHDSPADTTAVVGGWVPNRPSVRTPKAEPPCPGSSPARKESPPSRPPPRTDRLAARPVRTPP